MLEIVLPDHSRLSVVDGMTIGRAADNTVRLADPSVSRFHARISAAPDGAVLEDAGSSYGTWLDGRRVRAPALLQAGARIRVGNQELIVDSPRADEEAGPTIVVPDTSAATRFGDRPRVAAGSRLKRLDAGEGARRWVLQGTRPGRLVRLADEDAGLVGLVDGTRSLGDLVRAAEERLGPGGPARLTLLLASLGEHGLLAGGDGAGPGQPARAGGRLRRLVAPRQLAWAGAGDLFDRLYRLGGWALVARAARVPLAALALVGVIVFAYLVAGRYGTPFVVARKVGIGGLVFMVGRLAVAAVHETAHGLVMASFGRRVREAGVKLVVIFPYVYVDTSDAWFEPRRHRIAVSAAGPTSDLCLGAAFSLACLATVRGPLRDVLFQLAFGAYLGAFFNLNPLVERDGYQILADVLREPALRRRAREQLRRRIAEGRQPSDSAMLLRYSLFGLAWSAAGAAIAVAASLRYEARFAPLVPSAVIWPLMVSAWALVLLPVLAAIGPPLLERVRAG